MGYNIGEKYIIKGNPIEINLDTSLNNKPSGVKSKPIDKPINDTIIIEKKANNVFIPGV